MPIPDKAHARNAVERVVQHGYEDEHNIVRAAVVKRSPVCRSRPPSRRGLRTEFTQRLRVSDGVAIAVIVEVGVDVASG